MKRPRVFLTGGDGGGWAIDEDMRLAQEAMGDLVEFVDLEESEIVHALWWEGLLMIETDKLIGKRIVCHVPGEPFRYLSVPRHRHAIDIVGRWITRTSQAAQEFRSLGISSHTIPYLVDQRTFRPLDKNAGELQYLCTRWNIPTDAYLVGNFHRDTEGADLRSPKLVKGPDMLLEILLRLQRHDIKGHAVLAGPRRHWLLRKLDEYQLPYSYIGQRTDGEDMEHNTLPRATLNQLYNLLDMYIVTSRSEGGPHSILEAAAAGCPVISTRVGIANDFLHPVCIFTTASDAANLALQDCKTGSLGFTKDDNLRKVHRDHRPEAVKPLFELLYNSIETVPVFQGTDSRSQTGRSSVSVRTRSSANAKDPMQKKTITVGLWHKFFQPPYGGGNQFMMALRKTLLSMGIQVRENELDESIDAYVLNSIHFDVDRFLEFGKNHRLNVIHRIDGPIHLIRGFDREKDELCYRLNAQFASATVLQSAWTYQRIVEMGYQPISPVIIHNAVDADIFHPRGRVVFSRNRKTRLISTSWSNNPRKGGPTYRWIEDNLDWDRFDYTFVGNASEQFNRIRHVPPVSSGELGEILRQHDIYITASRNDPCSNALIEAMACGLPALYFNDGGHPELVGFGGLPFTNDEEIPPCLDRLADDYEGFQRLISVPTLEATAEKYLDLVREVIQ